MFERFADRAKRVVVLAQEEARELCHHYIGTEHLLLGLLQEGESVAAVVLRGLGVDYGRGLAEVVEIIGRGQRRPAGHIPFTPRVRDCLERALRESLRLGHDYIGPEHLFLGVLREGKGVAVQVLLNLGISVDLVFQRMDEALAEEPGSERRVGSLGMFERFADRAKRVVVLAQEEARELCHHYIGTEHLLLGLLQEGESVAAVVLRGLGVDYGRSLAEVAKVIGRGQRRPTGHIPFTPRAKKSLERALRESLRLGHDYIGPEHLFLGVLREGESVAVQVLLNLGISVDLVFQRMDEALAEEPGSERGYRDPDPSEGAGDGAGGTERAELPVSSPGAAPEAEVNPQRDITLSAAERDRLHEALAVVFPVRRVVERVLRGTDYPLARLPSFEGSSPLDAWDAILLDLQHGIIRAGFHQLLAAVVRTYPHHPVFRALAEEHGVVRTDLPTS